MRQEEIYGDLGISRGTLEQVKADLLLPHRNTRKSWHRPHLTPKKPDPDVSPEEVQHRIAQCQSRWTDEMFVLRSMGRVRPLPYVMPVVSLGRLR